MEWDAGARWMGVGARQQRLHYVGARTVELETTCTSTTCSSLHVLLLPVIRPYARYMRRLRARAHHKHDKINSTA